MEFLVWGIIVFFVIRFLKKNKKRKQHSTHGHLTYKKTSETSGSFFSSGGSFGS